METYIRDLRSKLNAKMLVNGELKSYFPEVYELKKFKEINQWHRGETTFEHTWEVLNNVEEITKFKFVQDVDLKGKLINHIEDCNSSDGLFSRKELVVIGTILHDIGKMNTFVVKEDLTTGFPNHETEGVDIAKGITERIHLTPSDSDLVLSLVKYHASFNYLSTSIQDDTKEEKARKTNDLMLKIYNHAFEVALLNYADFLTSATKENNPELFLYQKDYLKNVLLSIIKNFNK